MADNNAINEAVGRIHQWVEARKGTSPGPWTDLEGDCSVEAPGRTLGRNPSDRCLCITDHLAARYHPDHRDDEEFCAAESAVDLANAKFIAMARRAADDAALLARLYLSALIGLQHWTSPFLEDDEKEDLQARIDAMAWAAESKDPRLDEDNT